MLKKLNVEKSQMVLLLLYLLVLCTEFIYFMLKMRGAPAHLALLSGLFIAGVAFSLVLFFALKTSRFKVETVLLVSLIAIGAFYIVAIGPLKSNDETVHYINTYWLSNLMLGFDPSTMQMRVDDFDFYNKWSDTTLSHEGQFAQLADGFTFFAVDPNTVLTSENSGRDLFKVPFQQYLFPAIGLSLGRILGLGAVPAYYLGRLLALASFAAAAYVAVRNTPIGKPVFMVLAFFPMTLELSSSFCYDGPTIAIAFLLCSFCFKAIYAEKQSISTLIVIAICSILLVPLKVVYSTIILLALAIPAKTFPKGRFSAKGVAISYKVLLLCACILTFVVTQLGATVSIASSDTASYSVKESYESYTVKDLLDNPLWAAHVFLNSFFERADFQLFTYLGSRMGQNNLTPMNNGVIPLFFFVILIFAFTSKDSAARPANKIVGLCIACFLLSFFAIELSMFIGNAERGSDVIYGVLGRYFIPLTPLLIPLFYNCRLSRSYPTFKALMFAVFCLNILYSIEIYGFIALA